MPEPVIRSVAAALTVEVDKVKGSRFIGDVAPATTEGEALAILDEVRAREPKANHHCWAFELADGRSRCSDDGEPSGTAGPPILRRIGGAELSDVVVVVTRYFGGTKLGTGGLVRAYGSCAGEVLAAVAISSRPVRATFTLTHDYSLAGVVQGVLNAHRAQTIASTFGAKTTLTVAVPLRLAEGFVDDVREATAGAVLPVPLA